jgi:NADH:ubiquinone oxidoreductase subunit H
MMQTLTQWWEISQPVFWPTLWIVVLTVILILSVAYLTLWERKLIGWMQVRKGPNRVRIFGLPFTGGLGQPFADVIKLVIKEIIVPSQSNKILFRLAPAITLIPAFAIWAVMPLGPEMVIANIDAGLLYVLSLTSVGVYGVILAGWASNSKYALLGAMRSAAQIVAYEIAMGFALANPMDGLQQPEPGHHHREAAGRNIRLVCLAIAAPVLRVLHLRRGRNQPRSLRCCRRRIRNRGRLPRGVFRHRLRAVLPG